jgi:NADH-quinone oxidoreductase subunit L
MHWHWLDHYLDGTVVMPALHMDLNTELMLMGLATVIAVGGIYYAWLKYAKRGDLALEDKDITSASHKLLLNKYWFDELYDAIIRKPVDAISKAFSSFIEPHVIDGLVEGTGSSTDATGNKLRLLQSGSLFFYILAFVVGLIALLLYI